MNTVMVYDLNGRWCDTGAVSSAGEYWAQNTAIDAEYWIIVKYGEIFRQEYFEHLTDIHVSDVFILWDDNAS